MMSDRTPEKSGACRTDAPAFVLFSGGQWRKAGMTHECRVVPTALGRFRKVGGPTVEFLDRWLFECPGCQQWAYLDDDQWHGRVSVDHAADGCPGGYHETHDYFAALEAACNQPPEGR